MRILADQAAGGDMEKLEEMFDKGILYTEKYLPAVLAEMKRQSDGMMEEYWKSLPYMVNQANRQRDLWLREFTMGGGEKGLAAFWNSWIQIQKDSIRFAGDLGNIFEGIARKFSAAILVPGEFLKWMGGETNGRNLFVHMFGEAKDSEGAQLLLSVIEEISTLGDNLKQLSDILPIRSIDSTLKEIKMILEVINSVLSVVNAPLTAINSVRQRGVFGHMSHIQDVKSEKEAERIANQSPLAKGSPAWQNHKDAIYSRLLAERESSYIPDSWRYQGDLVMDGVINPLWGLSTSVGQYLLDAVSGRESRERLRGAAQKRQRGSDWVFSSHYPEGSNYNNFGQGGTSSGTQQEVNINQKIEVTVQGDSEAVVGFLASGVSDAANQALVDKLRETITNYGWTPQ